METLILCEGITDQVFIADCLTVFYNFKFTKEASSTIGKSRPDKLKIYSDNGIKIIDVGGCSKLSNYLYLSMMEDNVDGKNIVIFDADYSNLINGNRGYSNCSNKLNEIKLKNKEVKFDHYIWPNNAEDGIIENLLELLIPIERKPIYNCIEHHKNCLSSLEFDLNIPGLKEKVNYYLYTCNQKSESFYRNYTDQVHWNLNYNEILDLEKLKIFFDAFFNH